MNRGTIHAAWPGLTGDHRTDGIRCSCDPFVLRDINETARAVVVHRAMADSPVKFRGDRDPHRPMTPLKMSSTG